MKLRFAVNQAEAFRQGIDCPKSIVTVEVNPAKLSETDRHLLADRMTGIDVCQIALKKEGATYQSRLAPSGRLAPMRIVAKLPTFAGLMEAVHEDERNLQAARAGPRKNVGGKK